MNKWLIFIILVNTSALWGQPIFQEITESAGVAFPNHKNRGIAFADFDNDGDEDIYAFTRLNENQLYENQGDGSFINIAPAARVHHTGSTRAAVWGDINNDGWLDLYIANYQRKDALYLNNGPDELGHITFTNISLPAGIENINEPISAHMSDVNQDGFLDIYVANFRAENRLYHNNGNLTFSDITHKSNTSDSSFSMGCIFFDYDRDGDDDLYLVHDFLVPNTLYQNDGSGQFIDVSTETGLDYRGYGMGVDIADINHDGWMDIYITNLNQNTLFVNQGNGTFLEIGEKAGVDDWGMGWATQFLDVDNDGWVDLYVVNDSHFSPESNALFHNQGELTFEKIDAKNVVSSNHGGIGGACADIDNDGFIDIAIANSAQGEGNQLFLNQGNENQWIAFQLTGTTSNRSAIGAQVQIVYGNGTQQWDQVVAGSGFAGHNSLRVHFGLEKYTYVDQVIIHWPSGTRQVLEELKAGQVHQIKESATDEEESSSLQILPTRPNPFQNQTLIRIQVEQSGWLNASVMDLTGKLITNLVDEAADKGILFRSWNVPQLAPGLYIIEAHMEGKPSVYQKIIKH